MRYNDWISALYDEYSEEYNNCNPKIKFKDFTIMGKIKMIVIWALVIALIMIAIYSIVTSDLIPVIFYSFIYLFVLAFISNVNNYKLESCTKRIKVLKKVLEEQKLFNKEVIVKLEKESRCQLYRDLKFISLIAATIGADKLNLFNTNIGKVICIVLIIVLSGYLLIVCYPNGKMQKRRDLYELLKVLLVYYDTF